MPSTEFYASPEDFRKVLNQLMENGFHCFANDSSSTSDVEYTNEEQILNYYKNNISPDVLTVVLWHPSMESYPVFESVKILDEVRYQTHGWGLIRINLGTTNKDARTLSPSWCSMHTQKSAKARESFFPNLGSVSDWEWSETEKLHQCIKSILKDLSVDMVNSIEVLPEASVLQEEGYRLISE